MYKKYGKSLITTLLYSLFLIHASSTFAQTYGLKFNGRDVTLDKRTELNLTPDGFLKLQDEFEISFDYKVTRINPNSYNGFFGYIFRIINEEDINIDLLSTPTPDISLNLVFGKLNTRIPINYPEEAVNNWFRLRIKFLLNEDKLIFYTPDTFYVQKNVGFSKNESFKIIFGANDYKQFKNTDVPSMTIKDLEIVEKGKLKFQWPLNEKQGNIATDRIKGKEANVINPSWVVRNNYNWQKIYEDEINDAIAVAADTEEGRIFIIGMNELVIYSTQKNSIRKIKYNEPLSLLAENYRVIYNTLDSNLYCYLVDKAPYYKLDIETGEWIEIGSSSNFKKRFVQHNSYFNAEGNQIYLFGGYGLHHYENTIRRLDLTNQVWEELTTNDTVFPPRYLAGLGELNDTIYILGGYGSESGDQLINPKNYLDLIGYSIKNKHLFKKFEISKVVDNMVIGNSMWINEKTRNYYALVFSKIKFDNHVFLIEGNLDSPNIELVGDSIPFKFLDMNSFISLHYMPTQDKLFAFTSYANDSTTQVKIYSIDYPPDKILDESLLTNNPKNRLAIFSAFAILFLFGIMYWMYKRKRKTVISPENISGNYVVKTEIKSKGSLDEQIMHPVNFNMMFFGGFQVFNKNFEDITNKFSPTLKELFLLIFLFSFKNNKGISSEKIIEILWNDKSEKSARNNRAVSIARLRIILEEIGSCDFSKKTGYWKIVLNESEIHCDYVDFMNITDSKNNLTRQKIDHLIEITKKGAFLSNVNYEWLDDFKSTVSDRIIDSLVAFGYTCNVRDEADFIVHLADSVFNFDMINEDAMILKCKALYCMGKHSHSKACYDKFFKEYSLMYGQEYGQAFLEILEIKE